MEEFLKGLCFMKDPFCRVHVIFQIIFSHVDYIRLPTRIIVIFTIFAILLSSLVTKVALLVNNFNDMILMAELIPSIATLLGCVFTIVIEYCFRAEGKATVAYVITDLQEKRSEAETAIKKTYERNALLIIRLLTISAIIAIFALVASLFIPHFLDIILPINGTRPRELPFHGEHFVDEEKYFYYIAFSQHLTCVAVAIVVESMESISLIGIFHLCGMMAVYGYKVENVVQIVHRSAGPNAVDYEKRMIHEIKVCCNEYNKTSELFNVINSIANVFVPFLLIITFISFSMLLVTIVNVESIGISNGMFTLAALAQFALVSFMGQYLVNESSKLPCNAYNALWYKVPVKIQRMFLLLMIRTQKPFVITAATYQLSVGSFAAVVKTATSFCMVLKETQ